MRSAERQRGYAARASASRRLLLLRDDGIGRRRRDAATLLLSSAMSARVMTHVDANGLNAVRGHTVRHVVGATEIYAIRRLLTAERHHALSPAFSAASRAYAHMRARDTHAVLFSRMKDARLLCLNAWFTPKNERAAFFVVYRERPLFSSYVHTTSRAMPRMSPRLRDSYATRSCRRRACPPPPNVFRLSFKIEIS